MGRQWIAALLALGAVNAAHSEVQPGKLGYYAAIFELENGRSFCVESAAMSSILAATRAATAPVDPHKPAEGIVARLAHAFPCPRGDRTVAIFSTKQLAKALLEQELSDAEIEAEDFRASYGIGLLAATNELRDGKAYCLDNPNKQLSEALREQQKRTPNVEMSAKFIVNALTAGFPCKQ